MVRVLTWPDVTTAINPYLRLFYRALEPWQIRVVGRIPLANDVLRRMRADADVLHIHWGPDNLWRNRGGGFLRRIHGLIGLARLLRLARNLGMKIIWTIHDLESHDRSDFLDRRGYRLLVSNADLCICHDEEAYEQSLRRMGCRAEKLLIMAHGNYDGEFPAPCPRQTTLSALGLDDSRRTLLCFGLARPYKGFDLAIEAMNRLPSSYQLIVAGAALDKQYGEELLHKAAGNSRICLLLREQSSAELANLVHACDGVVLPYRRITGSGVLLTAATLCRGVVASDLPYFRRTIAPEAAAGTLFRPGDAIDLARAVEQYFSVPVATRHEAARRIADAAAWDKVVLPVAHWFQYAFRDGIAPATESIHQVSGTSKVQSIQERTEKTELDARTY
jgi:glycosyltransferase involved in cell wall biosynthesis